MSRQKKDGLSYFPLVVDFFKDRRIRRLISRFGADGALFYLYILCAAYERGYYIPYDDDFVEDAALDLGCTVEKIGLMLNYLLDKSLLDGTLFNTVKVITSHGIQTQYQESTKGLKRDIEVDPALWVLSEAETQGFIKVRQNPGKSGILEDKSGKMSDKSGKMNTNKIKEKETKSKERKEEQMESAAARDVPGDPSGEKSYGQYVRLSFREFSSLLTEYGYAEFSRRVKAVDLPENEGKDFYTLIREAKV